LPSMAASWRLLLTVRLGADVDQFEQLSGQLFIQQLFPDDLDLGRRVNS
jgi:hypothetical protein